MHKIGVILAMEVELDAIRRAMDNSVHTVLSGMDFYEGSIHGREVVVACSGIGKVCAGICAQTLIIHFQVGEILCGGIAGSLGALPHGGIAIGEKLVQHDFDLASFGYPPFYLPSIKTDLIPADPEICRNLLETARRLGYPCEGGIIASGDIFIDSAELRQGILDRVPAIACEMEGAAIAQVCYMNRIPFGVIRCISDSGDEQAGKDSELNEKMASEGSASIILAYLEDRNYG